MTANADGRPVIPFSEQELHENIRQGIAALATDPDVYMRGEDLVHVVCATQEEQDSSAWVGTDGKRRFSAIAGTPKIHRIHPSTLRERLSRWAVWERIDRKGNPTLCDPPDHVVDGIANRKEWPGLRTMTGVIETPTFDQSGDPVDTPGHNRRTGFLYAPPLGVDFGAIKRNPTRDDAVALWKLLADIFVDFPYATPAGISVPIAAAMSLVARPAIEGPVPCFIFDATTPGSGKSLQVDIVSALATGREAGRRTFPFTTGIDKDSELAKVIGAIARRGASRINFDNLDANNGTFGGSALENPLTARDTYGFRILGKSEDVDLPWRTVVLASGNNVTISSDMERRSIIARLESPYEDPENRPLETYKHPDRAGRLFEYVLERRAELVNAMLTILRAYFVAGKPDALTLGSFESWASIVPSAIVWAGGPNPLACRPKESGTESPERAQHRALAKEWQAICSALGAIGITVRECFDHVYPKDRSVAPDPRWDGLRDAIEHFAPMTAKGRPDAKRLSDRLSTFKGKPVRTADAPAPLRRFIIDGKTGGSFRWTLEDIPAFKLIDDANVGYDAADAY